MSIVFWRRGVIAQLGERLHGMQEVNGSIPFSSTIIPLWGYSSVGRASALQAEGLRFDPVYLHHYLEDLKTVFFIAYLLYL